MTSHACRSVWLGSAGLAVLALAACGGGGGGSGSSPAGCVSTATVICTQSGQVQGAIESNHRVFRGIPFAAPPVGNLRWRPPESVRGWQGVRSATTFGNRCPQLDSGGVPIGDEDCLTLNVFTVNPAPSSKLPVIVFIHGGGGVGGSAQEAPWYAAPPLTEQGVVVVTVEYRLGLLGFLVHPLLTAESPKASSGNYGLMDVIASLQWVHDNVAGFGGDPARVMIVGHSWGSVIVESLLASPAASGLFSAAGMESGLLKGGLIGTRVDDAYRWYADVASVEGCGAAADVLACLRAVPAGMLVQSAPNRNDTGWVNVESIVLPEDPYLKLQRLGSPVPLIIGSNADEMAFGYVFAASLDATGYADSIHSQFDAYAPGAGDAILSLYPATDYTNANYALETVESDLYYTCHTRNFARDVSGPGRPPVRRYVFTHAYENPSPQDGFLTAVRAFHGAETYFVTGNFQTLGTSVTYSPNSVELALSSAMMGYWARLATTGDPNGTGAAEWMPYDASTENILRLDDTIVTLSGGFRNAQCDFISSLPVRF